MSDEPRPSNWAHATAGREPVACPRCHETRMIEHVERHGRVTTYYCSACACAWSLTDDPPFNPPKPAA